MDQLELVSLDKLVSQNHEYRKFRKVLDFSLISEELLSIEVQGRYKGYGIERLFKCLLLQFMEDLSDRELERYMSDNMSARWFCEFSLQESTPDHSVFSRLRTKIGTKKLSNMFSILKNDMKAKGYISEVFTFVDASSLIAKASIWQERDKAIEEKIEKLNNETLPKVARDKDAKIGCKGKDKFWYGYKKHLSVDMQSGHKVTVTPANIPDAKAFKHVCPRSGAVYADKAYCTSSAHQIAKGRRVHLAAIKKNNMKNKNHDLDRYYSKLRAPFERVFSKQNNRTRYLGIVKNQFAEFMNAIVFNLRRLSVLTQ
jgi:transposase, IS5 family